MEESRTPEVLVLGLGDGKLVVAVSTVEVLDLFIQTVSAPWLSALEAEVHLLVNVLPFAFAHVVHPGCFVLSDTPHFEQFKI